MPAEDKFYYSVKKSPKSMEVAELRGKSRFLEHVSSWSVEFIMESDVADGIHVGLYVYDGIAIKEYQKCLFFISHINPETFDMLSAFEVQTISLESIKKNLTMAWPVRLPLRSKEL